jgi:hypothetical protein
VYSEPVYHALCEQAFDEVLVVNPDHVKDRWCFALSG